LLAPQPLNRRKFVWLASSALVAGMAFGGYANRVEPRHLVLERRTIRLPRISPAVDGFRIALMSDHGPVILPPWGRIYHTGFYELNGHYVYTGRGLGMVGLPLRLVCPPELTEITLEVA
jgi:predicted MPP superfamily phosphohydrolase